MKVIIIKATKKQLLDNAVKYSEILKKCLKTNTHIMLQGASLNAQAEAYAKGTGGFLVGIGNVVHQMPVRRAGMTQEELWAKCQEQMVKKGYEILEVVDFGNLDKTFMDYVTEFAKTQKKAEVERKAKKVDLTLDNYLEFQNRKLDWDAIKEHCDYSQGIYNFNNLIWFKKSAKILADVELNYSVFVKYANIDLRTRIWYKKEKHERIINRYLNGLRRFIASGCVR